MSGNPTHITQILDDVWDQTNHALKTGVALTGDIEIGAVELKNGADDTRAVVSTAASAVESNAGLVVHEPVLGLAADAAVTTNTTGTISGKLRGMIAIFLDVLGVSSGTKVITDASGSIQQYLRGLIYLAINSVKVGGNLVQNVATFTRPGDATPYSINDAVNNSTSAPAAMQFTTAGRVVGGTGYIVGAEFLHEVVSVTPRIRLYLFNASPTMNNDNATYAPTYALLGAAGFLGVIDLDPMTSTGLTDASRAQNMNIRIPYYCTGASQIIYALAQTLDAFTPGNGKGVTCKLYFDQN